MLNNNIIIDVKCISYRKASYYPMYDLLGNQTFFWGRNLAPILTSRNFLWFIFNSNCLANAYLQGNLYSKNNWHTLLLSARGQHTLTKLLLSGTLQLAVDCIIDLAFYITKFTFCCKSVMFESKDCTNTNAVHEWLNQPKCVICQFWSRTLISTIA